jgi:hypothetical protein
MTLPTGPGVIDWLAEARAALYTVGDMIHADKPDGCDCDTYGKCVAYHDAMRAVVFAADMLGVSREELDVRAGR